MFGFSKKIPEMDQLIQSVKMNMENNYKDCAQANFRQIQEMYCTLDEQNKLSERQRAYYEPILTDLAKRLEGFTHKEQKAFWYIKDNGHS